MRTRVLVSMLAVTVASAALAQEHAGHGLATVAVTGVDFAFQGAEAVEAGFVNLTFTNAGQSPHHVQVARLNDDVTLEQLQAALQQGPLVALPLVELVGGVGILLPGQSQTVVTDLNRPGTYLELCFVENEEGVPHLVLGMMRVFQVTESSAQAAGQPDIRPDLVVRVLDFGFDIPERVPTGPQVWQVVNDGPQPHEMAMIRVLPGHTVAEVMAALQAGGEAATQGLAIPYGGVQAMAIGLSGFIDLDLESGSYIVLCFVPDPASGQPHLALGMLSTFVAAD